VIHSFISPPVLSHLGWVCREGGTPSLAHRKKQEAVNFEVDETLWIMQKIDSTHLLNPDEISINRRIYTDL